ncbi:glycosyltransferase, partial [Desulfonatronospira sp. MSAO_Bac3]|uniref:glycosyltransferase n=1 Tax=Desulfonatronospira sp. MSAO_Bac3 TaxID=2293857 RepID=UPI000FF57BAC
MFNESPFAGRGQDPEELLARARQALDNEDWSTAVKVLNSILLRHKKEAPAQTYSLLALALRAQDKLDRAEKIACKGMQDHPDDISILTEYADIARARQDWAEAERRQAEARSRKEQLNKANALQSPSATLHVKDAAEPELNAPEPGQQPVAGASVKTRKIMWLSPMFALDRRSGAACQIYAVLCTLARAGWDAYAVNMTLCDGQEEYPVGKIIGESQAGPENHGKVFKIKRDEVKHNIFYTRSSYSKNLVREEAQEFFQHAKKAMEQIQPDVVITYGGSKLWKELISVARKNCKRLVFFMANTAYDDAESFRPFDTVLINSNFNREHYLEKIGIDSLVLPEVLPPNVLVQPEDVLAARAPEQRGMGLITMVNPSKAKGATLFARLANMALSERPDLTFMAVEGRMTDEQWKRAGINLSRQPNVWWIPNQENMTRVYARTSILLFPSFWNEAAGRVGIEASLGGIPVLASNHAGIPEMLNGAGFLFDIPDKCREKYSKVPSPEEVRPWLNKIIELMDNEEAFREASQRAVECCARHHPGNVKPRVVQLFEDIYQGNNMVPPLQPGQKGKNTTNAPVVKGEKTGRNQPCPCGSRKKNKKCCRISEVGKAQEIQDA